MLINMYVSFMVYYCYHWLVWRPWFRSPAQCSRRRLCTLTLSALSSTSTRETHQCAGSEPFSSTAPRYMAHVCFSLKNHEHQATTIKREKKKQNALFEYAYGNQERFTVDDLLAFYMSWQIAFSEKRSKTACLPVRLCADGLVCDRWESHSFFRRYIFQRRHWMCACVCVRDAYNSWSIRLIARCF